jgi:hypothetical protein
MKDYFKRKNEEEKQARQETEVVDPPKKSWFRQHVLSLEFSLSVLMPSHRRCCCLQSLLELSITSTAAPQFCHASSERHD